MEDPRGWGRTSRVDLVFVALALTSGAILLYLGRSLTFWHDEWRSITFDGGPLDYLRPVNQHWSTFPLLLYRGTFRFVELRSYVPYLAEVVVLHLVAVAGAYALMRKRVGPLVATLAAVPLLFLGSGAENLFWAFQTGFVGSVMFGLWALFFIERPGRYGAPIASLLLLASLMSSGMGPFFLVVAAVRTILDASLRRRALAVAPPFAAYLVWFALVGRDQVGNDRVFVELSTLRFFVRGVIHATERVSGLDHLPDGHVWGMLLFLGLAALTGYRVMRGRTPALAAGCVLGVVALYTVVGIGRAGADPGYDHATASRFVYVAAFFLVLAIVDLLPERGSRSERPGRLGMVTAAVLVLALAWSTASNLDALRTKRAEFQHTANVTRAFVDLALTRGHEPWVDRRAQRGWMPSIAELESTVERHGSPVHDDLFPYVVEAPGPADQEEALLRLIGDGFRVEEPSRGSRVAPIEIPAASGSDISKVGRCARAYLNPGVALWILDLPAHARVRLMSPARLEGRVFLAHEGGPSRQLYPDFEPGIAKEVVIPDVDDGRFWALAMDSPISPGVVKVCVLLDDDGTSRRGPRITMRRWD